MTERDWAACDNPERMVRWLWETEGASDRRCRLFAVGCCRRIRPQLVDARAQHAVEAAEAVADGTTDAVTWTTARQAVMRYYGNLTVLGRADIATAEAFAACDAARAPLELATAASVAASHAVGLKLLVAERAAQAALLRCIFGNPFRTVTIEASWRTPEIVNLAQEIYDGRDFARLPELAEALIAMRCEDAELLGHLRSAGPHARGCLVLDLLLCKA